MSRSGYVDEFDDVGELGRWRGMVASATRGKRGQAFFKELLAALDEMPEKVLIEGELQSEDGGVCALGSLGVKRGLEMQNIDPYEWQDVGAIFGIAGCLAAEIEYMNDDYTWRETPHERWKRMRAWVASQILRY